MVHTAEHGGTVPPTVTKPDAAGDYEPIVDDAGAPLDTGLNPTAVVSQWPGLKQIYLGSMGPQLGFDRLVNILLDNQIFVVNAMNAPPGATESIDLFG